jgi:Uma2 family endonuclease
MAVPPHASPSKLTYEDYLLFPEDGRRHELLDGEHFVTDSPFAPHQDVVLELATHLRVYLWSHPIGRLFSNPMDVILARNTVVQPDLLFISQERTGMIQGHVHGVPDLMVEVLSDSTRRIDQGLKREIYERSGVREYWLIDHVERTITIYRLAGSRFRHAANLRGDALASPLLPGFALPLARLFSVLS